jgi:hypothetical protein
MYLFVRYFTYLRGFDLTQKQQVESPVNILQDSPSHLQQGPFDELRERTLATLRYLGQHRLSSTPS